VSPFLQAAVEAACLRAQHPVSCGTGLYVGAGGKPTQCASHTPTHQSPSLFPRTLPTILQHKQHLQRLTQWVLVGRSAHSAAAAAVTASYQGAPAIKSAGPSDPSARAMAGEFWINLFGSCVMEQEPQPNRHRPKISRDMIGQPTNFRHTSHVGSSDIGEMSTLQSTMKGKGDEEMQHIQVPHIMNARSIHELKRTSLKA